MPKAVEKRLKETAQRKFPDDKERQNAYVYGALRHKTRWTPIRIKRKTRKEGAND